MQLIDRLERAAVLDPVVSAGQRAVRLIRPGKARDALNGVWLGHPVHPTLVQAAIGAWLSASIMDLAGDPEAARLLAAAGLAAAVPAAATGAADWSEQHEQQMRVGVVHAAANTVAAGLYGASLAARGPRLSRALRLGGLAAVSVSGLLGGHIAFRLAGGANHAEDVPHLLAPGWHYLMVAAELPEGRPVRRQVGEVPVVAIRRGGTVHVLAERCSHMSGPLSEGELSEGELSAGELSAGGLSAGGLSGGCLTCPWHGSRFRIADGSVARGPATAPQPSFEAREVGGAIQVCLPGAG